MGSTHLSNGCCRCHYGRALSASAQQWTPESTGGADCHVRLCGHSGAGHCALIMELNGLAAILADMPVDHNPGYARIVTTYLQPLIIILLVLGWRLADHWQLHRPLIAGASVVLPLLVILFWDDRGPYERILDRSEPQATLAKMIPERQGEILWLTGNTEAWFWLGRANWLACIQGASIVFSRPLAMFFGERAKFLIELDLAGADVLEPWSHVAARYP